MLGPASVISSNTRSFKPEFLFEGFERDKICSSQCGGYIGTPAWFTVVLVPGESVARRFGVTDHLSFRLFGRLGLALLCA
jgi:hypothetical protein